MSLAITRILAPLGHTCRSCAAALIAGVSRKRDARAIEDRLKSLPVRDQVWMVGSVLMALFMASLFAAQFGIIGLLVFFMLVIVLIK